jgi:uncharacterized protein (TIGR02246 family)
VARSDIDTLNAAFEQAVEKGDSALLVSLYAPDARVLPPGSEPLTGAAAIQQFWQGVMREGVTGARLETVSLEELGDVAVEEGRYEMRAGDQVAQAGKYVVVHRRQPDGAWKLGIDMWSPNS